VVCRHVGYKGLEQLIKAIRLIEEHRMRCIVDFFETL
jgi:hypothetical protein